MLKSFLNFFYKRIQLKTDTGLNLLEPGDTPVENAQFLIFLCAIIKAVDEYQDLLRISIASAGNDHRLGGSEAPPAIVSIFLGDELTEILESIEKNTTYANRRKSSMAVGVHTIPSFPSDNTDRNRTSPFAFTGNKFEFRMPGSSASISTPNTILNTVVAEELKQFADQLEKAEDLNEAVHKLIGDTFRDHKRIIFNGNGYDAAWVEEAKARGLSNYPSTPEALAHYLDEKNVRVFAENGVLSEAEMRSRYEIYVERYYKTINIEARTLLDMLKKDILPASAHFDQSLSEELVREQKLGLYQGDGYAAVTLKRSLELKRGIRADVEELEEKLSAAQKETSLDTAFFFHDEVLPLMDSLRTQTDALEEITDRGYWPMPTYNELLFGVD